MDSQLHVEVFLLNPTKESFLLGSVNNLDFILQHRSLTNPGFDKLEGGRWVATSKYGGHLFLFYINLE